MSYRSTSLAYHNQRQRKNQTILYVILAFVVGLAIGGVSGVYIFLNLTGGSSAPSQPISAPTISVEEITPSTESSEADEQMPALTAPDEESDAEESSVSPTLFRIVSSESEARFSVYETFPEGTAIGRTREVAGDILVDFDNPQNSQLGTIRINLRTLVTDDPERDKSIRCCVLLTSRPEFEFADFVPTQVSGFPDQVVMGQTIELQIAGNLTLRGVTNPVTFTAVLTVVSPEELRGLATTVVRRSDFSIINNAENGFDYHGVEEEVDLAFEFVARTVP
jgi:polyisoprenoid-binding protein YceI